MIYESAPAPVSGKVNFTTSHMKSDTFEVHYHSCYEIYYFLKGDADYMVEGREYHLTPHSLILLSPYVFHGVRVNSTTDYVRCPHFREIKKANQEKCSTNRRKNMAFTPILNT